MIDGMSINDLYFQINPKTKKIVSEPKELDYNWKNISGLIYLSEDKIYDLSWAGYDEDGFIKINKNNCRTLEFFDSSCKSLDKLKNTFKKFVSEDRYSKETGVITINKKYSIQLSERCKLSITMKYLECLNDEDLEITWKTLSGYIKMDSNKFKLLFLKIQKYIQTLFDEEKKIYEAIDSTKTFSELLDIDLKVSSNENLSI